MANTMCAGFLRAPFQVQLREVPVPDVCPGWILVQVQACGICGSDLFIARHSQEWQPFGHEIVGVAARVGSGVKSVREGDHVALQSNSFCVTCDVCRDGRVDLCPSAPFYWRNPTMGFAEHMLAPEEAAVVFDGLSFEHAAIVEPMGVALDMVYTADIRLGNDVLVVGLGPIGLMAVSLARRLGAGRIYAAHSRPSKRLQQSLAMGADEAFCVQEQAIAAYPYRKKRVAGRSTRDHVVDRALVTAPPRVIPEALSVLNYGGILSFVGIDWGKGQNVTIPLDDLHFNKGQLRASHAAPALYFPTCLQLLKDGQLDADRAAHSCWSPTATATAWSSFATMPRPAGWHPAATASRWQSRSVSSSWRSSATDPVVTQRRWKWFAAAS